MRLLRRFADNTAPDSLANALRRERFSLFLKLLETVPRPVRILDVGGTEDFWKQMGFLGGSNSESNAVKIVLLNITAPPVESPNIESVAGNGCSMPQFKDGEFDIVFSNSVIEHVPDFNDQLRMAAEIQRIGKRFYVQTPNRYFPIEPHFLFPFFQFLPMAFRSALLQRFDLGWYAKTSDPKYARELVESIRLLTEKELCRLFPGAKLYREYFKGLVKSLTVYGGFPIEAEKAASLPVENAAPSAINS